ncbi:hypothetical protein OE88DRAFT_1600817, partial [Heliocybe sulcata]
FPPKPASSFKLQRIMHDFSKSQTRDLIEQTGCAVCGVLCPRSSMYDLENYRKFLHLLVINDKQVTRVERLDAEAEIKSEAGPVLAPDCNCICQDCQISLSTGVAPVHALANGLWLGKVPTVLQGLTLAEKMMIARVRHNRCVVRVASGGVKMRANAIMFANPTPKIYQTLPPPRTELEEVLAFIYTGPVQPTDEDFKRTPLLVSHKKVSAALEWLKLNHTDYKDLDISYENLKGYKDNATPVVVSYHPQTSSKEELGKSLNHDGEEEGTETGPCSLVVHGVTGSQL